MTESLEVSMAHVYLVIYDVENQTTSQLKRWPNNNNKLTIRNTDCNTIHDTVEHLHLSSAYL